MSLFTIPNAVLVALMQVVVIVFGVLYSNKAHELAGEGGVVAILIREAGFLLLLLPVVWIAAVLRVRSAPAVSDDVKALAFVSGIVVLCGLAFVFIYLIREHSIIGPVDVLSPEE